MLEALRELVRVPRSVGLLWSSVLAVILFF